jgi:cell filamentation protein
LKRSRRYDISHLVEAQFEPGSRGRVLKNLLRIRNKREMDQVEAREHLRALEQLIGLYDKNHRFNAADISKTHGIWLEKIYGWAGRYRQVNLSKGEFSFAAAKQIPRLMTHLEKGPLREFTPCRFPSMDEVVGAISVVHTELLLIHPFRDGNGRAARMLAILMALQADLPPLDFGSIRGHKRQKYYEAVQAGLEQHYELMDKIFRTVIRRTLRIRKEL